MATLYDLKKALERSIDTASQEKTAVSSGTRLLSTSEYSDGFQALREASEQSNYRSFILPQLESLLTPLVRSHGQISVLEIGPGPKSVLRYLSNSLRSSIRKYDAYEPHGQHATDLQMWLCPILDTRPLLPCLETPPIIHRKPFTADINANISAGTARYDVILFCHSMYGMSPKREFLAGALGMLDRWPRSGLAIVFHREETLRLNGLPCHKTAVHPSGTICVKDDNETLDRFAPFVAGFAMRDSGVHKLILDEWRDQCRVLGRRDTACRGYLLFSSPNIMVSFASEATGLAHLTLNLPSALRVDEPRVKNRQARLHSPAAIVRPTEILHVQHCLHWAAQHGTGLTVVGGSHSGQCIWPNVVAVDMSAFNKILVIPNENGPGTDASGLVVAEAGCTSGDIIRETIAAGLTVPLGARPSVGAGLWLQGGIGHLSRLHGLSCDKIIGVVMVSASSGRVLCVGHVPNNHLPDHAEVPDNADDLLWALKGAGTNFGVVISVVFKAYAAPMYSIRHWVLPLSCTLEARRGLQDYHKLVSAITDPHTSVDAYLFFEDKKLRLGVTMIEASTSDDAGIGDKISPTATPPSATRVLGPEHESKFVDNVGLFDTEMYMSGMHGGHAGGKTSSFKRCLFFKTVMATHVADKLLAAIESRPSPLCYFHLLQGGGAIGEMASDATAFGCRDWDLACVVTGVWSRDQDGTGASQAAIQWVYKVAHDLLRLSHGAYGADLGPYPRDAALAVKAFGSNVTRLVGLKKALDPHNILAYACPLVNAPSHPALVIIVTGDSGAGKDYCAAIWASSFVCETRFTARDVSISHATKREFAAATGADLDRLLEDRAYKEKHRDALTAFFQGQVNERPGLREQHFLDVVNDAMSTDVLLITGMRDKTPVAAFSHLVPTSKVDEVRVQASKDVRRDRGGCLEDVDRDDKANHSMLHKPDFVFHNDLKGGEAAKEFARDHLLRLWSEDLQRLGSLVRTTSDFPRMGVEFRHVLGITQQPHGLHLCASLLKSHFQGQWRRVDAIVCCGAGEIYASALAFSAQKPLALIREAGKLPPPDSIRRQGLVAYFVFLIRGISKKQDSDRRRRDSSRCACPCGR
ncbi:phosphoribosyl transferase domain protein [Emericellopsis atlantica]|uniref:Phosphoribosyl transferase domain protein n=1 Tax=Emericellopsis atlantica TaxID=2614577 RepID=A0A9P7ZFM8_9HYPO|nr:phosphoribosyl transferase domain protein [Emericellopsis atlantica]KAG9250802.1 phosphoribosyl transferase domain protein [Emericellopsis atlantica]